MRLNRNLKRYVEAAQGVILKMIIEVCYLTDDEIKAACELCIEAGIDWVKSSTELSMQDQLSVGNLNG